MKRLLKVIVVLALLAWPGRASAGKVDNVKNAVRDACKQEIPIESMVTAVVRAYDCEPGQDVTIAGCKIKCLKSAGGNVVGK